MWIGNDQQTLLTSARKKQVQILLPKYKMRFFHFVLHDTAFNMQSLNL